MLENKKLIDQLVDLYRGGKYKRLLELAGPTANTHGAPIQLRLLCGVSKLALGEFTEAVTILTKLISDHPKYTDAYNNLGLAYKKQGELELAEKCFAQNIKLDPKSVLGYTNLGNIYILQHKYELALSQYKKAIEANPNYHVAIANIGNCYRLLNKLELSIKLLESCAEKFPMYSVVHTYLAMAYMSKEEFEHAYKSISRALEVSSSDSRALIVKGEILYFRENYMAAKECFLRVVQEEPWQEEAWIGLGKVSAFLGMNEESIRYYDKALACQSSSILAKANLANVLITTGRYEKAKELIAEALAEKPNDDLLNYNMGVQLITEKRYTDAIVYLSRSNYEHAAKFLLEALYKNHDRKGFERQLKRVLEKDACNAQVGSLCTRGLARWDLKANNPYCAKPLDYIFKESLLLEKKGIGIIDGCIKSLNLKNFGETKAQGRLKNGMQTAGNIFASNRPEIAALKELIEKNIQKYRDIYRESAEPFLNQWPESYMLLGWIISMESGGSLNRHMHETSWLTGTFYINIPDKIQGNQGSLVVSMSDEEHDSDKTSKVIGPETGDLILFPASLQHNTIPFQSSEKRIVLAFDLLPRTTATIGK